MTIARRRPRVSRLLLLGLALLVLAGTASAAPEGQLTYAVHILSGPPKVESR